MMLINKDHPIRAYPARYVDKAEHPTTSIFFFFWGGGVLIVFFFN